MTRAPARTRNAAQPAVAHLARADERLAAIIDSVGPYRHTPTRRGTHFAALLRAIVYQQLAGAAAATIYGRVCTLNGGRAPTPEQILAAPAASLRALGLSRQKLGYMKDLAERMTNGTLPLHRIARMGDDEVIAALTEVKGIGRWTAQIFLQFRLGRPDVLPEADLGIHDLTTVGSTANAYAISRAWRNFASKKTRWEK